MQRTISPPIFQVQNHRNYDNLLSVPLVTCLFHRVLRRLNINQISIHILPIPLHLSTWHCSTKQNEIFTWKSLVQRSSSPYHSLSIDHLLDHSPVFSFKSIRIWISTCCQWQSASGPLSHNRHGRPLPSMSYLQSIFSWRSQWSCPPTPQNGRPCSRR